MRGPQEPAGWNLRRGIEGGTVVGKAPHDLQPARARQRTGRRGGTGPCDGQRDGERAPVATRIGVPGKRLQPTTVDAQREAERAAGGEILLDQADHRRAPAAHDVTRRGQGNATSRRCGTSTLA